MAEKRTVYKIQEIGDIGEAHISVEVFSMIVALAATEVEGVASLAGNITNELVSRLGMKGLQKGVKVEIRDHVVKVDLELNLKYDQNILETSKAVQERVKNAVENMTGFSVSEVNVRVANINTDSEA